MFDNLKIEPETTPETIIMPVTYEGIQMLQKIFNEDTPDEFDWEMKTEDGQPITIKFTNGEKNE